VSVVKYGWDTEWSPIRCPAAAIAFDGAGKSLTKSPVRLNVALTRYFASVPRMDCTPSAFAPASKVSATTLACVGIAVQFCPPRPGGTGRVAADAAGSGAATASAPTAISASGATRGTCLASLPMTLVPFIVITTSPRAAAVRPRSSSEAQTPGEPLIVVLSA
jgi:hypothetical protein